MVSAIDSALFIILVYSILIEYLAMLLDIKQLTNRKSLVFTRKTPGKTQQFNYFAVNDKPELARQIRYGDDVPGSKDRDAFYMVDLPGFGFAKVPRQQRGL